MLRTEHHYVSSGNTESHFIGAVPGYTQAFLSLMDNRMPATTPIARTKTAALARVLDCVPKGYHRYTHGTVSAHKAEAVARKFHALFGVGCTPAQRLTRKAKGLANAILVMYWPEGAETAEWLLLVTDGTGLEGETLQPVDSKPRLKWLGYELSRRSARGRAAWTWRRPKAEMAEWHALLAYQAAQRNVSALTDTLERIARQPGFHGVRSQSWTLLQEARRRGYCDPLPYLFYLGKVSHGERMSLADK